MRKSALTIGALVTMLACLLHAAPAYAQANRTFVSGSGSDSNPCTVASPCRSFQAAFNATVVGGEIDVLEPAGYRTLSITHAISIQGHDYAGISVPSGGTGITISSSVTGEVNLRGLLIDGGGSGSTGISSSAGSLNVQDCVIRNLTNFGIFVDASANSPTVFVSDTLVSDIAPGTVSLFDFGIAVGALNDGKATAVLTRVHVDNSANGIKMNLIVGDASIVDSVVSNSTGYGVIAEFGGFTSANGVVTTIRHSDIANNGTGVYANGGGASATIVLSQSILHGNATAWSGQNGGSILSTSDNLIVDNAGGNPAPGTVNYQ
jgi:hypothetical protein